MICKKERIIDGINEVCGYIYNLINYDNILNNKNYDNILDLFGNRHLFQIHIINSYN